LNGAGDASRLAPDQQFAVQHRAVGQAEASADHLGEAIADQLLAARPDPAARRRDAPAARGCRRTSIRPASRRPQRGRLGLQRVRQEERIRLPGIGGAVVVGRSPAAEALGQDLARASVQPIMRCATRLASMPHAGQRALHQQLADAHAKAAADQLDQQEALGCGQRRRRRSAAPVSGGRPRSGSRRCSTQCARPIVACVARRGSTWAMVSARSPTAW
jgi:hypothetical protein